MRRGRWTVLLVSEEGDDLRQFSFGPRSLQLAFGSAGFLSLAVVALFGSIGYFGSHDLRTSRLAEEKALLSAELGQIQERVNFLEGTLGELAERDAEIRTMAGLDRIDEEVLQVGIGGPGSPTLQDHPIFALDEETGKNVFAVNYDLQALERRSLLLRESLTEAADSLAAHRDLLESTPSILPTLGRMMSSFSNARLHPIHNQALPHEGIDISAPRGTPIMAAAKGRVTFAGNRGDGYGNVVEVDHGYGYSTLYGHASQLLVTRGQEVARGDVIALVGATGIATGPHLHYEVRVGGRPVNPMGFVITGAVP